MQMTLKSQKPKNKIISEELPAYFVYDGMKRGWVKRVNFFFGLGRRLYAPTFLALFLWLGLFFVSLILSC